VKHHPLCELDPPCHPDCPVGDGRADPARVQSNKPAQGIGSATPSSSSSSSSSSPLPRSTEPEALRALIAEWRPRGSAFMGGYGAGELQCADELEALVRASSPPPPVSPDWQPIETAPIDTNVLVCWIERPHWRPKTLEKSADGAWENEDGDSYREPSHWMPLPVPPSASGPSKEQETAK